MFKLAVITFGALVVSQRCACQTPRTEGLFYGSLDGTSQSNSDMDDLTDLGKTTEQDFNMDDTIGVGAVEVEVDVEGILNESIYNAESDYQIVGVEDVNEEVVVSDTTNSERPAITPTLDVNSEVYSDGATESPSSVGEEHNESSANTEIVGDMAHQNKTNVECKFPNASCCYNTSVSSSSDCLQIVHSQDDCAQPSSLGFEAPAVWDTMKSAMNVKDYGAKSNNSELQTEAFQAAINNASTVMGGGLVVVPPGRYIISTLELKSHVTLYLMKGARIVASGNIEDYDPRRLNLLYANNARNITLTGYGIIDGSAESFFTDLKPNKFRLSPLLEIRNVIMLTITGITIEAAPGWTIRPKNCDMVTIAQIMILNDRKYVNTDGIDPDSSTNVDIYDCFVSGGDDAIVLKSSNYGEKPSAIRNVSVRNSTLISSASALKIGTESFSDFENISFSDIKICESRTGIAIIGKDGGNIKNVSFKRISMHTAPKWGKGVEWPVLIDVERRHSHSKASFITDIILQDVLINTKGRLFITGMQDDDTMNSIRLINVIVILNGIEELVNVTMVRGSDEVSSAKVIDYASIDSVIVMADARNVDLDVIIDWSNISTEKTKMMSLYANHVKELHGRVHNVFTISPIDVPTMQASGDSTGSVELLSTLI
eukprot:CFRG1667T1